LSRVRAGSAARDNRAPSGPGERGRVSSATADKARFDIALQARAVDRQTVEADVVHLVQREAGVQVDGVDCAGGLDPQVGDSVVCTVSGSGERLDVRVAVSSVDGGLVDFDLQPA
jgi:hypothetical protein